MFKELGLYINDKAHTKAQSTGCGQFYIRYLVIINMLRRVAEALFHTGQVAPF
jgi:hypothetical protein